MKLKNILSVAIAALLLFTVVAFSASAKDMVADKATKNYLSYTAVSGNDVTVIYPQTAADGKDYLFLPSSADLTKVSFNIDDSFRSMTVRADNSVTLNDSDTFDLLSLFDDPSAQNGEYTVTVIALPKFGIVSVQKLTIMKSENISTVYLSSSDPENKGREWVDSSKSNKADGNMAFVADDGTIIYEDKLTELKARGNSTFTDFEKKAYQIKIKNKYNLTGDESNAQKKWVLLANAADITLIHNQLASTLAKDIGLPYTIDCEPVDLYYDGEYRGSYLLTDKVEVDDTGVDIQDLDGIIEELNEDTDAYENPAVVTKTRESGGETDAKENSAGSLKYVENLVEPTLEEGTNHFGYLLELDFIYRYPNEQSGFVTDRGQAVVTKNPEYLTKETGLYISNFFQEFEDAVFSEDGYNAETGKYYYEYCDLDSLVKIYLINEYTKNYDSYRSSTFFYLPEDEDIMYAGPIWDYDLCFTTGYDYNSQLAGNPENFWAATKYLASTLITIESFRDAVKEYLNSENGEFYLAAAKMLGEDGNIVKFSENIYASQKMNYKLWDITHDETAAFRCCDEETYENGVDFLLEFTTKRLAWLSETTSGWNGDNYNAPMDSTKWTAETRYHANIITTPEIKATCTEDGKTGSVFCVDCGKVYKASKVIKATGHVLGEATCNSPAACTVCGEKSDKYGEHKWSYATCLVPETCEICGETRGENADHDYTPDPYDNRNSEFCTVYTCRYCNELKLSYNVEAGDVNADGKVNAADARLALRIASGLEETDDELRKIGDMNGDNKLNAADARLILRKASKLDS